MDSSITIRIEKLERDKIEARIKQEYPALKNVSELVRAALDDFLKDSIEKKVSM